MKTLKNKTLSIVLFKKTKNKTPNSSFFPNKIPFDWNNDNFGPIFIPKAGAPVDLNLDNLPLYKKIIVDYEKNKLETNGNTILINGKKSSQYKFKMNYYWMMGDNRHRSEDSRYWGFVPEDHIVGKPVFIWFSIDGINDGIRNWKIGGTSSSTVVVPAKGAILSIFCRSNSYMVTYVYFRKRKSKTKLMVVGLRIPPKYLLHELSSLKDKSHL